MNLYLDTSALVKLLIDEPGTEAVGMLWDEAHERTSSRLLYPETRAALAQAMRGGRLTTEPLSGLVVQFDALFTGMTHVELGAELAIAAGQLAEARGLRGYDAVHLASALAAGDDDLVFATFDDRLRRAADAEGLAIPELG